ncbi:hypothetical protein BGZ54_004324 [Gamsiella multidivaricata]|nr:hypothetical protein BGZ54_004324 [Gamsiella multidivaricata]
MPQGTYGPSPSNEPDSPRASSDPNFSTPLLGQAPATPYTTIPVPPVQPTSQRESSSEASSKWSRFWLVFFFVIVVLSVIDDNTTTGGDRDGDDRSGGDKCGGKSRYTTIIASADLQSDISDFSVISNGMASHVVVDQTAEGDSTSGMTKLTIEASGTERDDLRTIRHEVKQDSTYGTMKATVTGVSGSDRPECLRTVVRISFPPTKRTVERIKLYVVEGNVTVELLDPKKPLQVSELDIKVITGHSLVNADVLSLARIGGSVGSIRGDIVVGSEFSALMVDGHISINLVQKSEQDAMESKVETNNGNIIVGLPTPYVGEFKVETTNGKAQLVDFDSKRTHVSYVSPTMVKGWSSATGKSPGYSSSFIKLVTRNGRPTLSMKRIEL